MPWSWSEGHAGVPASTAIARKFSMYRTGVMPTSAGQTQVTECDLAFHAGAEAMLDLMTTEMPDDETAAMRYIASLKNELLARAKRYVSTRS